MPGVEWAAPSPQHLLPALRPYPLPHCPPCRDSKNCPDPNSGAASCRYYVVKSGDYIAYIAAGFSVSVDDLLSVNNDFTASSILSPGQRVCRQWRGGGIT